MRLQFIKVHYIFSNFSDYFFLSSNNFFCFSLSLSLISLNFFYAANFISFFLLAFCYAIFCYNSSIFFSLSIMSCYNFWRFFSFSNWCYTSLAFTWRHFLYLFISFSSYCSRTRIGSSSSNERYEFSSFSLSMLLIFLL